MLVVVFCSGLVLRNGGVGCILHVQCALCSDWRGGERIAEESAAERAVRGDHGAEPRAHRTDDRADRQVRQTPARAACAYCVLRRRRQHSRPARRHSVRGTRSSVRARARV